ncbi:hypothetical protein C8R47DRAFT_1221623 [Mycena vitilis]|nr:hypothetical protein C8R47DRAFT_1221623 [Mycena vitilis]
MFNTAGFDSPQCSPNPDDLVNLVPAEGRQLIEVFNVVEVGGRPPLGGKAGARGEWTIGDLTLPVPGKLHSITGLWCDVRRYPPQHINAVLWHAVRFLGLLAWYLGVKLPLLWLVGAAAVMRAPAAEEARAPAAVLIGPQPGGGGRGPQATPLHLSLSAESAPAPASSPSNIRSS